MMRTVLAALALAVPFAAAADVEPGQWELTLTTRLQGAEAPFGPVKQTQCITAEDAAHPGRLLGQGVSCEFANRQDSGDAFRFDVSCGGLVPMSGTGRLRYGPGTFEGDLDLGAKLAGGQHLSMHSHVSGRRLGPCAR